MAITLNPPAANLGIMAPVLGPWFSQATVNLDALDPTKKLGLTVNFAASTDWYAPATGTLSLYITDGSNPPAALDALQDSDGAWPFPNGRLLAFFRLLPEVEARLHELMGLVPAATSNPIGVPPTVLSAPTRPQVRSFAMLLPQATPLTPAGLYPFFGGAGSLPGSTDAEHVTALGLAIGGGGTLMNGAVPMTWLRRPGGVVADRDKMLEGLSGAVDLWAFDRRGRAIDPGAVAAWWSWLLNTAVGDNPATAATDFQLIAPNMAPGDYPHSNALPVVVQTTAQRTLHLVDAHEGPLSSPFINGRLQNGGSAVTDALIQPSGNNVDLTFSPLPAPGATPPPDNPQLDNAPRARMAALPTGTYGTAANVWPSGPVHAGLARDFVRVAVVEEESHLVGVTRRDSRAVVSTPNDRRQSAQNRPSTRININRTSTTNGVLLPNGRLVADALLALPNAASPTRLVLGIADTAWGGTPSTAPPAAGAPTLPTALADSGAGSVPSSGQYRVRALAGGGALAGDHQTVLVEVDLGNANAGAWVRAWPLGFDLASGVHFRLTGGAGRADGNGVAQLVMVLAPGKVDAAGLMGMDILVLLTDGTGAVVARRSYADRRFARPAPLPGTPATTISGTWVVCETGVSNSGALPAGAVPPGGHVVLLGNPPSIVDRTTLPAAAWDANTLRNRLRATDIVSLMTPSFGSTPDRADTTGRPLPRTPTTGGDPKGGIDTIIGTRLHLLNPGLLSGATASSVPYQLLERLEVAAATTSTAGAGTATAAIGSISPVPWALEPAANLFLGHPGVPAAIETQGAGISLSGAPAVAVAEYVRERTAGLGFAQVQSLTDPIRSSAVQSEIALAAEAATPLPAIADGAGAGPVVAVLRTVAFGLEGIPGVGVAATQNANLFPFSQNEAALEAWLNSQISAGGGAGTALRNAAAGPIDSMTRALDRRILTAAFGAREALTALLAAIDRAQDLIYMETAAVDNLAIDSGGENLQLWQRLISRMTARKGLRVALCVPTLLAPGTPKRLQEVRDHCLMDAVDAIRGVAADRFALFSPGAGAGRAVRLAGTSVVVDDAFALTGTTHLSRRGLSWDSSLAASVFDERLVDGRPQDVRSFRIQLMADRLGTPVTRLPADGAELVKAIRDLDTRGSERLSATPILRPTPAPPNGDIDIWNPDGSKTDITLASIATLFASAVALTDLEHAIVEG
jgi:hypothetical protein